MPAASPIRVSILIPNFNNGRQSSRSGSDDLLGNLLVSIEKTLRNDRTPFEIIAYDDGSTDDSLETLRAWSKRRWPDGRPFLELIEAEHCGYLSRVANILSRRARGDILVRLDGDIVILTPNWVTRLCEIFDNGPDRLGVVGPKQLGNDGKIHAYGDFVIHPNGYTHVACGMDRDAVKHPLEVDHIMGCFYCCRKRVFEDVGGYDENFLRGQTEDLGLRALLKGWRAFAVPDIEFVHLHSMRLDRATEADSNDGIDKTLRIFEDKWGFSRLAPDLDLIARRYAGTGLLWNRRVFGALDAPPQDETPASFEQSDWSRYARDAAFQTWINMRVSVPMDVIRQVKTPPPVVALGVGQGLAAHLLATQGVPIIGIDDRAAPIALAQQCTANHKYPAAPPRFIHQPDTRRIPMADASAGMLLILDVLERHPNPVALLREAHRVLRTGCIMVIISQRKRLEGDPSDPADPRNLSSEHRYRWIELVFQVQAMRGWHMVMDIKSDDPRRDMVLAARRLPDAAPQSAAPPASTQVAEKAMSHGVVEDSVSAVING